MNDERRAAFIKAATWYGSLDEAEQMLASHPEIATCDIHTACITGDVAAVKQFLAEDPKSATAVSEPYGANALVHLCFSKYLQKNKDKNPDFIAAATALLDAGADPNSGFMAEGPYAGFESALYGAAGVAHNAGLTKLLLERGAEPNDEEAVYHSPETYENDAMKALVETGKLIKENLSVMLIRKLDWHDYEGLKYMLDHGADPNGERKRGWYALHHSLMRANGLPFIELLLDHGADPLLMKNGFNAVSLAACEGRADVLQLLKQKGVSIQPEGIYKLIAACAEADTNTINAMVTESPALVQQLLLMGGELLSRFSIGGNTAGVQQLLKLGIPADAPYRMGDGYYGIPTSSLAIHVAAWRGFPAIVQILIDAGSPVDVPDKHGHTPLALAVKACVDSYWTLRRSPDSVKALLAAGASPKQIPLPTGYEEIDVLLKAAAE
jgi:ankyrin repeat protein